MSPSRTWQRHSVDPCHTLLKVLTIHTYLVHEGRNKLPVSRTHCCILHFPVQQTMHEERDRPHCVKKFFGLATNTLNLRNNDGDTCSVQNNGGLVPDIMYGHTYSKCMDQPCKVTHPARGRTGKINFSLSVFAPENLISRDGFGSPVLRQPAHHLHITLAESCVHSPHSRLNVVLTCGIPPHTVRLVRRENCPCCGRITCYRRIVQFIYMTS